VGSCSVCHPDCELAFNVELATFKSTNNTGIQDFWGLEVCNGFGGAEFASVSVHLARICR